MAVRSRDEILASVRARIGDNATDDDLSLFEDISDTFDSFNDGINWKQKYEENDNAWRQRYRERFFTSAPEQEPPEEISTPGSSEPKQYRYENLFKEG